MNKLNIVDMFCGGGGESTGLIEAAHEFNFDINMSAINHWERAIETHSKNYPFAEHRCENVQHIEPETLRASKECDLMWASPGCQHFSSARGGKPRSEDKRSPAWEVVRFAEILRPKRIIIENVPEFRTWGPLDSNGRIIPECKGKTFNVFIAALRSLNYVVDWRVLCAADYGAPTSRRRLFIQCVRKDCGKKVIWPQPTNVKGGDLILPDWHSAAEIIDWTIPSNLISERKKPLAPATLRRIEYGNGHAVPLSEPIPTLTTKDRYGLIGTDEYGIELGFRMLQPNELAAATGFPKDYKFTGTKVEVVKQIGNAVPPNFAKAMFSQILSEMTA